MLKRKVNLLSLQNIVLLFLFAFAFVINYGIVEAFSRTIPYALILLFPYVILFVVYILLASKTKTLFMNKKLLVVLVFLSIIYLFTIFLKKTVFFETNVFDNLVFIVKKDIKTKFESLIKFYVTLSVIFLIFTGFINSEKYKFNFKLAYFATLALCLFAIGYSLVTEMDVYKHYLTSSVALDVRLQSFTESPNMFATYLMCGCIMSLLDDIKKPRIYNWLITLILLVFMIFTKSKTAIFLSSLILFYQPIGLLVRKIQSKEKKTLIFNLVIVGSVSIVLFILFRLAVSPRNTFVSGSFKSLLVYVEDIGFKTINVRKDVAKVFLKVLTLNPINFIFGFGYDVAMLQNIENFDALSSHNQFIQTWVNGGLFCLIFYIVLIVLSVLGIIRIFKKKEYARGITLSIVFLICLIHQVVETVFGFRLNASSLIYLMFIVAPLVSKKPLKMNAKISSTN